MTWTRHKAAITVVAVLVLAALVAGAMLALRGSGGQARPASATGSPAPRRQLLSQGWLVSMDGKPAMTTDGGRPSPATVVIQYTRVGTSRFLEYGKRPPYAESTGSGTALVLRDGKAWTAHWSRPKANGGTTFTTAEGKPMTFAPGQVWIVLAHR